MATRKGKPAYRDDYARIAGKVCARWPALDKDLGDIFGVPPSTVRTWMKNAPDFAQAVKDGKAQIDSRVERALYERAIGYSHPAVKIMQDKGVPVIVPYTEHYPPDTSAAVFWLNNRQPERWRRSPEEQTDAPVPVKITIEVKDASIPETG